MYGTEREHAGILSEFLRAGLARNEKCIYVVHGGITRAVQSTLRAIGAELRVATEGGAIELRRAEELFPARGALATGRLLSAWRRAERRGRREGFTGLRVVSEVPRAAHGGPRREQWFEYERRLTSTAAELRASFLCIYARHGTPAPSVREVLRAHPSGFAGGIVGRSASFEPVPAGRGARRRAGGPRRSAPPTQIRMGHGASEQARSSRVLATGAITASIAHELRQPLAAVAVNAGAGLRWLDPGRPRIDRARRSLLRITRETYRAAEIISRIKALATRGSAAERRRLNINTVVRRAVALIDWPAPGGPADLRLQLASDIPAVLGDAVQLQQLVHNLVTNAVDAVAELTGGPRRVEVVTRCRADRTVAVTVRDSGKAVDTLTLTRAFEPFYTTKPQGMGLGLPICRAIVEAHGGRLWATPNGRRGAAFHFSLPGASTRPR